MSRVQFDERAPVRPHRSRNNSRGLTGWLIKRGYAANTKQANSILLGVVGVLLLAIVVLQVLRSSPATSGADPLPHPDDLIPME